MRLFRTPTITLFALALVTFSACVSYKPIQPVSLDHAALYRYEPALPYLRVGFVPIPSSSGGKFYPGVEFGSLALRTQNRSRASTIKASEFVHNVLFEAWMRWATHSTEAPVPAGRPLGPGTRPTWLILSIDPDIFAFMVLTDDDAGQWKQKVAERYRTSHEYFPAPFNNPGANVHGGLVGKHAEIIDYSTIYASRVTLDDEIIECDIFFAPSKSRLDQLQRIAVYRRDSPDFKLAAWERDIEIPSEHPLTLHLTRDKAESTVTFHLMTSRSDSGHHAPHRESQD